VNQRTSNINAINADVKKRRSFVVTLLSADYDERCITKKTIRYKICVSVS